MNHAFRYLVPTALLAVVLSPLIFGTPSFAATAAQDGRPDETTLAPESLVPMPGLQSDAGASVVLSPMNQTPRPFSYAFVKWQATGATSETFKLELRASADGNDWSPWREVLQNPDLWQEEDGPTTFWSQIMYAGSGQQFWQTRAILTPGPDGSLPTLGAIMVSTVDPDAIARPKADPAAEIQSAPGKPAVVSRTAWGSPDGQGSRVQPYYYRVNHMVVHHTADQNALRAGESDWSDRVLATWSFHTFTRGWGDVGYNFLIDPKGVIYEGRAGGDDSVGFHDAGNYGSMGVVLIGTYSTVAPPSAAVDSLVTLLAWKAGHRSIDPLARSYYYGCDISSYCPIANGVVDNISGHRHVNNSTSCPGDQVVNLLPTIRNRVQAVLDGTGGGGVEPQPDNGDLVIDELENNVFARSNATWYTASCGYGGNTFYTYATDTQADSTNSATWRPNIPETGTYRVYASIPQGCALATPPYATTKALYRIKHAGGIAQKQVDQNTEDEWVDLGLYTFNKGTDGAVELFDYPGEAYSQSKVMFFDTIKWVRETPVLKAQLQLTDVQYSATRLSAGETLKVTFRVKNVGNMPAQGQDPQAGIVEVANLTAENNGYVYDQQECFLGDEAGSSPSFPKQTGRFRVLLGLVGANPTGCKGDTGGYPWRWGLNQQLDPGQETTVTGYVRFSSAGTYQLQAGGVQEYVDFFAKDQFRTTLTVNDERVAPAAASYDEQLRPLALVYRLGDLPDNLLARATEAAAITRGAEPVGSIAWDGTPVDWGQEGPLGLNDSFVIEQTRVFQAPVSGLYAFRTVTDDGSWLWVDGRLVVRNHGLHAADELTGTIQLSAGLHVLSFKYFERDGNAAAGYSVQLPGGNGWQTINEGLGGSVAPRNGVFAAAPQIAIAADDQGGSGIARIRYTLDGTTWVEQQGALVQTGKLVDGSYTLRYQAIDRAGNAGPERKLSFQVNTNREQLRIHLPLLMRTRQTASYPAP